MVAYFAAFQGVLVGPYPHGHLPLKYSCDHPRPLHYQKVRPATLRLFWQKGQSKHLGIRVLHMPQTLRNLHLHDNFAVVPLPQRVLYQQQLADPAITPVPRDQIAHLVRPRLHRLP